MYHLEKGNLRVCGKYVRQERNRRAFAGSRFIILQHLLPDTEEFIELLKDEGGAEIFAVLPKPYSVDPAVLKRMQKNDYNIISYNYQEMESSPVLDNLLQAAIEKSAEDGKRIVVMEVGGYFAAPLGRITKEDAIHFAGVVEDTTFGHRRYEALVDSIPVPVFSVARSRLKEIEARSVGEAAVLAIDMVFRDLGTSISGRNALVVGYGMIGKNVARSLSARDVMVSVYDTRDHRNLTAFSLGFKIHKKLELLQQADIVFSCTGTNAIGLSDIEMCKDNVVLASVGSKDIEFDVRGLRDLATKKKPITGAITKYILPTTKNVFLVRSGTAVNFLIGSVPSEIMDLVFGELLLASILLLKEPEKFAPGNVYSTEEKYLSFIAKDWLKFINH